MKVTHTVVVITVLY